VSKILSDKGCRYWQQINTAFEVRNLIEHRDGQADRHFRELLASDWAISSWGARERLERLEKVVVEDEDVIQTYRAMLEATSLLTRAVLEWSARKRAGH